jgi:hypothetical protein
LIFFSLKRTKKACPETNYKIVLLGAFGFIFIDQHLFRLSISIFFGYTQSNTKKDFHSNPAAIHLKRNTQQNEADTLFQNKFAITTEMMNRLEYIFFSCKKNHPQIKLVTQYKINKRPFQIEIIPA